MLAPTSPRRLRCRKRTQSWSALLGSYSALHVTSWTRRLICHSALSLPSLPGSGVSPSRSCSSLARFTSWDRFCGRTSGCAAVVGTAALPATLPGWSSRSGPATRSADRMRMRAPGPADGPPPAVRRARPSEAALLDLQTAAGNAAASALLGCRAGDLPTEACSVRDMSVQRYTLPVALAQALARPYDRAAVQRSLTDDLRKRVDIYGPPDYHRMMSLIRAASVAERKAALADTALMNLIGSRFNHTWATTLASVLLEGTHKWANPPANDFFKFFVLGIGSGPANPASTMNCWESIMYAAYLTGAVSPDWIKTYYNTALAQPDPNVAAYALLGWTTALPTYDPSAGREPTAGQLVFYQTGGSSVPGHVAIYLGNGQIMSLWTRPRGVDHIQQVGIREIPGTIYFRDPPW